MAHPDYDRLVKAIGLYKSAVNETLTELRRPFFIDLTVIVIGPLALAVVAGIFSNVAGFLTTLGLGGINAEERLRRGQTVLKSYWGECSKLRMTVKRLEFELLLCSPSKKAKLHEVENLLREYVGALLPVSSSSK